MKKLRLAISILTSSIILTISAKGQENSIDHFKVKKNKVDFEFENKWLGFGRMKWNLENNEKWTTKYRTEEFSSRKLQFF